MNTVQWFKNGDHPKDNCGTFIGSDGLPFQGEGHIVRCYRHPDVPGDTVCGKCRHTMHEHGWIDLPYDRVVCPGDLVETDIETCHSKAVQ